MEFNFLGVVFISGEIPEKQACNVEDKMNEIVDRYTDLGTKGI